MVQGGVQPIVPCGRSHLFKSKRSMWTVRIWPKRRPRKLSVSLEPDARCGDQSLGVKGGRGGKRNGLDIANGETLESTLEREITWAIC